MNAPLNRRILLIDDLPSIHEDFRRILSAAPADGESDMLAAEEALFGVMSGPGPVSFSLDSAYQGREGLEKVQASLAAGTPYALAFIDMRMPPGWDGVRTVKEIWRADPSLQVGRSQEAHPDPKRILNGDRRTYRCRVRREGLLLSCLV